MSTTCQASPAFPRTDLLIATASLGLALLGISFGWNRPALGLAVATVPLISLLATGHNPGRGAIAAALGLCLALVLLPPSTRIPLASQGLLLGGMALSAVMCGQWVDRSEIAEKQPAPGRWVHIVIETGGPADTAGPPARPKISPHPAPERRSNPRIARDRRKARPHHRPDQPQTPRRRPAQPSRAMPA